MKIINHTYKFDPQECQFQEKSGTQSVIIDAMNFIQTTLNNKEYVINVLVDIKKVFDTAVEHRVLLVYMKEMGIKGTGNQILKTEFHFDKKYKKQQQNHQNQIKSKSSSKGFR